MRFPLKPGERARQHMMQVTIPLTSKMIAAEGRLHVRIKQLKISDSALQRLAESCPGFDREETLLKVVAINALYGTNVYAQIRMAEPVCGTLRGTELNTAKPELVERLARLPKTSLQGNTRCHISFASKFAHFFIDRERFPIMDSYAVKMLNHHLDRRYRAKDPQAVYLAFVANVNQLRQLSGLQCSTRELDQYLWLACLYRSWRKSKDSKINREVSILFANESASVVSDLRSLSGSET